MKKGNTVRLRTRPGRGGGGGRKYIVHVNSGGCGAFLDFV